MDRHFIESYDDEREILRKIEELKLLGCNESEMYVLAWSREQLTMIRTRTDIEFYTAEEQKRGRHGIFNRNYLSYFKWMLESAGIQHSDEFYQDLIDGKLLFFCNSESGDQPTDELSSQLQGTNGNDELLPSGKNLYMQQAAQSMKEDEVILDSRQYETFPQQQVLPLKPQADDAGNKNVKPK